jgi:hypothetical protein
MVSRAVEQYKDFRTDPNEKTFMICENRPQGTRGHKLFWELLKELKIYINLLVPFI